MDYFVPDWDDVVDPWYNFREDKPSKEHQADSAKSDVRAHQIFPLEEVPYDGILVSRMTLAANEAKMKRIMEAGIHRYLNLPGPMLAMADCGAWGYADRDEPPFDSAEMLEFYAKSGFDYGVSIDHMIVDTVYEENGGEWQPRPLSMEEKRRRWEITVDNAKEMWRLADGWRAGRCPRIIGAIQGWDEESHVQAARELIETGYDYLGIGGIARAPTPRILRVAKRISHEIQSQSKKLERHIDLHFFGITRIDVMSDLAKLGVSSFDSASLLRKAWLSKDQNYYLDERTTYSAIRIPHSERSTRVRSRMNQGRIKSERLAKLEHEALSILRKYARDEVGLGETSDTILQYDDAALGVRSDIRRELRRTLRTKPWELCPCIICRELGVDVVLHRGNDRNRRRGFHNLWVFYRHLRKKSPRILVLTNCTQRKDGAKRNLPAFRRYAKSDTFQLWWKTLYDIRGIDLAVLSAEHGLLPWWRPIQNYNRRLEELAQDERLVLEKRVQHALARYDKVFFSGLGEYRKLMAKMAMHAPPEIELFPKNELSKRGKLDILELRRQMRDLRRAVCATLATPSRRNLDSF